MQLRHAIPGLALLWLGACGDAPPPEPIAVEAPAPVLERAAWERAHVESDFVTYREGRVVVMAGEDEGEPLAGAEVELLAPDPDPLAAPSVVGSAVTGDDGRFRVGPGLPNQWIVRVSKEGWVTTVGGRNARFAGMVGLDAAGPVTIAMRRSVTRIGRLLDADGKPLADEPLIASGQAYHEETRTGPDGRFVIHPPAERVEIEPAGADRLWTRGVMEAASNHEFELRVRARGVVRGTVIESETRRPLAGALVVWDGTPRVHTRTDARGRFEIAEPRERHAGVPVEGRLAAFAHGWGWRSVTLPEAGDVEIRLQRGWRASGRVVDGSGSPDAGARVLGLSATWDRQIELIHGPLTDDDGAFELDWLPHPPRGETDPVYLVAQRRGAGVSDAAEPVADGTVELVLPGERVVRGRFLRESGEGVGDTPLEIRWSLRGIRARTAARLPFGPFVDGRTLADGSFELHGVPLRRETTLRVSIEGGAIEKPVASGDTEDVSLVLEGVGVLAGQVVDRTGQLLDVSGDVTARSFDHPVFTNIERHASIEGGRFRIDDLPDAEYVVSGDVDDHLVPAVNARAGDEGVQLVAERVARLVLHTVFPDGAQPEDVTARVSRAGAATNARRIDVPAATQTAARRVQSGVFDIEASGGVWRARVREVRIEPGEERVVELVLERTLRVRGRLLHADGTPVPGALVRLVARGVARRKPETHYSDREGWLDLTGLTPGEWEASVVLKDHAPLRRVLTIGDDGRGALDLRLPAHGTLAIRVLTPDGAAAADALVDVTDERGEPVQAWGEGARQLGSRFRCDGDGRVSVRGMRTGRVAVTARVGQRQLGRVEADVVANETVDVTVRLE